MSLSDTGIIESFYSHADPEQAVPMAAYMRNMFSFLGIPKPGRTALAKDFLKSVRKATSIDWDFVDNCWEREREFQYLALNYLLTVQGLLTAEDVPKLRDLTLRKSWWDTVDSIDSLIGIIVLKDPSVKDTMREWSTDDSIWLRRISIDHQLMYKDQTDTALLEEVITNNLNHKEFFINKAIGWSLREYSKTNPDWVRSFLTKYKEGLVPLSIREASKYLS